MWELQAQWRELFATVRSSAGTSMKACARPRAGPANMAYTGALKLIGRADPAGCLTMEHTSVEEVLM